MAPLETVDSATAPDDAAARPIDALMRAFLYMAQQKGRPLSEADVRALAPVPATGLDSSAFLRAARRLGLCAEAVEFDVGSLGALPTPFAVLGDNGEVHVVMRRQGAHWSILDLIEGRLLPLSAEQVCGALGHCALVMGERPPAMRQDAWYTPLWRQMRPALAKLAAASFAINLVALATPLFMMLALNKVIGPGRSAEASALLLALSLGMLIAYLVDFALRATRGWLAARTGARLDVLMSGEVLHHLLQLPYRQFERTPSGVAIERLRQLDVLRGFFTGHMPVLAMDLAFAALFLAALFFVDATLGTVAAVALPIAVGLSLVTHRAQRRLAERGFAALADKSSLLGETVVNALSIKALGLEAEIERRWQSRIEEAAFTSFRAGHLASLSASACGALQLVALLAIAVIGVHGVLDHRLSVGAFVAANMLAARTLQPMRALASAWHQLQAAAIALRRIDALMHEAAEAEPGSVTPMPSFSGDIALERASYRIEPERPALLRDVSLAIGAGEIVGIIGPSGSGKTTLVNLVQGLIQPIAGRVLVDGMDVAHLSPPQLRSQIGCVPQELQLFSGSVRDNIALGVADKDPSRVVAVAKFVGAHDFIQRLPKGYNTLLGERGLGLSMGQRQLLCIARALIRNPRILILDEATSALDPAAEEQLLRRLKTGARGRTVIIITHRLAPLAIADRVALLMDGRIERVGPPTEVMAYARIRMAEAVHAAG
ncbi:MAG: peptidase domain-containing ABC transporter [Alphaproteobacteria bacterium]|nr:peptidase domain-containing ABC transporter [Alphaproteobacteria bacterium]MBV8407205.1 peptidase domain-containing ABC transporter [Alphaproteobacteria bacterium]